jgi:hypothetical protein
MALSPQTEGWEWADAVAAINKQPQRKSFEIWRMERQVRNGSLAPRAAFPGDSTVSGVVARNALPSPVMP